MRRAPIAGFLSLLLGMAFAGVALILLGWIVVTHLNVARGFDTAEWLARLLDIQMPRDHFGNRAINSKMWVGVGATMVAILAFNMLRSARNNLRPVGESDDGSARLALVGPPPRVGQVVEGAVILTGEPKSGERYLICLGCYGFKDDLLYEERMVANAVPGASGSKLPFRFEIPLAAPPTRKLGHAVAQQVRVWRISFLKKGALFGGSSVPFDVLPRDETGATGFAQLPKQALQEIEFIRSGMPPGQEQYYEPWQLRLGEFMDKHGWKVFVYGFFGGLLLMFLVFILFKP